jgi:hypothetical protein
LSFDHRATHQDVVDLSKVVTPLPFVLELQRDPPAMGIIMPKVGKAFWVFGFSSLGADIGGGGGSSSLGVWSGAW